MNPISSSISSRFYRTRDKKICPAIAMLALALVPIAGRASADQPAEKPIAHGRLHGVGPARPIYVSDLSKEDAAQPVEHMKIDAVAVADTPPDRHPGEKPIAFGRLNGVGYSRPIYANDLSRDDVQARVRAEASVLTAQADVPAAAPASSEKPIAHGRLRGVGVAKPIYASDFPKEMQELKTRVDAMAGEVQKARLNPAKDSVELALEGSISFAHHLADVEDVQETFTACVAVLKQRIKEKIASGTTTASEKAQFEDCLKQCDEILAFIDSMHKSDTILSSATHAKHIVDGWDKHKKSMAELKSMMDTCPKMMDAAMKCCDAKAAAGPSEGANKGTKDQPKTATPVHEVYSCPMHPQVVSDHRGDCPKCGMKMELKGKPQGKNGK